MFTRFFLGEGDEPTEPKPFSIKAKAEARAELQVPETESGAERREEREAKLGLVASDAAALKAKSFAACTPEELVALRQIMKTDPAHSAAAAHAAYRRLVARAGARTCGARSARPCAPTASRPSCSGGGGGCGCGRSS